MFTSLDASACTTTSGYHLGVAVLFLAPSIVLIPALIGGINFSISTDWLDFRKGTIDLLI